MSKVGPIMGVSQQEVRERRDQAGATLFHGIGEIEMREMVIEALRRRHRGQPQQVHFSIHGDLGRVLVIVAGERTGRPVAADLHEAFLCGTEIGSVPNTNWKVLLVEAMERLTRAGIVTPFTSEPNRYPYWYRLTFAGVRFIEATDDHPLLPGFIDRVRTRCIGIPDGVLALLVDAQACLDHMLLRPAVAVMGLAYETAVEAVEADLITRNLLPQMDRAAARRIGDVRAQVAALFPGNAGPPRDLRESVLQALDFADGLRRRRNDASHTTPRYDFSDRAEIEEVIVSAGRHLPNLWRIVTG